ncbi:MAG: transposase [Candidatus Methylomirabilales bacterium]
MGSTHRRYTQEYKAEAVELVINSGRPIAEVARNLGINEGTLGNWLNKAKRDGTVTEKPLSVSERAEFEEAKRQLQRVKMERDFLKKAAAWFAGQNQ